MASAPSKGELANGKLVRLIYVDESGTSSNGKEPWLVVAGVIVHGDLLVKPLESSLDAIARKHVPQELLKDFWFHATELFSGGKFFKRESTRQIDRLEILRELVSIPLGFALPIIWGAVPKNKNLEPEKRIAAGKSRLRMKHVMQGIAYMSCLDKAERWISEHHPDELARVFAEDIPEAKSLIKNVHRMMRENAPSETFAMFPSIPVSSIVGPVYFVEKREDKIMQLADICAFVIKKELSGDGGEEISKLYKILEPCLLSGPSDPVRGGEFSAFS